MKKLFNFTKKILFNSFILLSTSVIITTIFCFICWLIGFILHLCGVPYIPHSSDAIIENDNFITGFFVLFISFVIIGAGKIIYEGYKEIKDLWNES